MAMFLKDHELKFYNLIYDRHDKGTKNGYENFLLSRYQDGTMPLTAYPTLIELQNKVSSLDYDGEWFWSVQSINDTPSFPGMVIRKWQVDPEQYGLRQFQFKAFPGANSGNAIAIEYYNFPLLEDMGTDRNYIVIDGSYRWAIRRLLIGQSIKIGPNIHDETFWGVIVSITPDPNPIPVPDPDTNPPSYQITLRPYDYPPSSHGDGENVFIEARIFVVDTGGNLLELDPTDLSVVSSHYRNVYKSSSTLAFSIIKNIPNIELGNRTPALFFMSGSTTFCMALRDLSSISASQIAPLNYYDPGNTFIPVYELRIRNDDPEDINNHPQFYFLQQDYRTAGASVITWPSYNYITENMAAQGAFMVVNADPEFILPSGIVRCTCQILDNYRFPMSNVPVNWSVTPSGAGRFTTVTGTTTNVSGYAYATFSGADTIPFPTYISVTTTAF
jgi:hypothetical protein